MPKVQIAIGEEFFENLRNNVCYYADKTDLIYKLISDKKTKVTLFTRPRRFGKTLTMSMLQSFFDINRDSRNLFQGLEISKHENFCGQWMNQYPVLFLSLKDVAGLEYEKAYNKLQGTIASLCKKHAYLSDSERVNSEDRDVFHKLMAKKGDEDDTEASVEYCAEAVVS